MLTAWTTCSSKFWVESCIASMTWEPISDRVVNTLWRELSAQKPTRIQDMQRVIESDYVPEYDPFRFYLSRLPPFNYEGIYSQAYALYRQGFQYWFSPDEIRHLARHNEQFETASLEKELIDQYFRRPEGQEPGEFLPVSMALQIVGANITQKLSTVLLGRAFVEMGFEKRCVRHVRGYIVVRRSADEMRVLRQQMAQEGTDGTHGTDVF